MRSAEGWVTCKTVIEGCLGNGKPGRECDDLKRSVPHHSLFDAQSKR